MNNFIVFNVFVIIKKKLFNVYSFGWTTVQQRIMQEIKSVLYYIAVIDFFCTYDFMKFV